MSIFSQVSMRKPRRNTFNLTHRRKFGTNFGRLVPFLVIDTIPGDSFRINTSQLVRFAPIIAPVMHEVSVYTHFFKVPYRILWDNWENFITGGEDGMDASVAPFIEAEFGEGTIGDFLGIPDTTAQTSGNVKALAFAFSAYQLIFNEYYRDQNLNSEKTYKLIDGNNNANIGSLGSLRSRSWQHDYFTSALPWTQKGPEATIPLGTSAPIDFDSTSLTGATIWKTSGNWGATGNLDLEADVTSTGNAFAPMEADEGAGTRVPITVDNSDQLTADLSSATAATIIDLRNAFRLQEWLEKNARGGSRYIESIMVHFGVKSSDARLQRPEFLGGASAPITISEVLQTSSTDATTPQANMAGHGISVGGSGTIKTYCEEHGLILGIMSIMPKSAYQQGVPKMFLKFDKFDYYWPEFAHIGEQPVLNQEVYFDGDDGLNDNVFGYVPRYSEYKYINDSVHGDFKSTLDFWHMGRIFSTRPALNATFTNMAQAEVDRIFAVNTPEDDRLYVNLVNQVKASRPMPYFGNPRI